MRQNPIALLVILGAGLGGLALLLLALGVLPPFGKQDIDPDDYQSPVFQYRKVSFDGLPGWRQDALAETLDAFLRSCEKFEGESGDVPANPVEALGPGVASGVSIAGRVRDWRAPCEAAAGIGARTYAGENARTGAMRLFYEQYFQPLQVLNLLAPKNELSGSGRAPLIESEGLFTGYFEPTYLASLFQTAEFSAPVLTRPGDLVMVDLGRFRAELAGQRVAGRVSDGNLAPYADHAKINTGVAKNANGAPDFDAGLGGAQPLAWMRPNDLFFLQIQGSGKLSFRRGRQMRVGYDGQNGHPYTAIGRTLVERGAMTLEEVSMQSIRDWLDDAPANEARALRVVNASYVFFRQLTDLPAPSLGPLGAQGVQLTAHRSLAVDRRYHALGAPVWVSIAPAAGDDTGRLQRLFIAQDTGGAINGPVRGDIFAGSGAKAAKFAGGLRARGALYVLVPKSVAARLPETGNSGLGAEAR